ncbi:hypothetical protein B7R54_14015 [Subtercola boreus]|uniref:DUF202 domain-containing protein n=1 Tax=Subtercola boreus TaxID=120213 RepID=A0A3E0VKL6_9MICO|nr:DUF202 domain-containing protein [Subtercola boreus]RFA10199.1 hypothetical protein B7R54_14015 [Subtercola boreus]TQL52632.1 putative membrane protein [Subtercola boreus]
MTGSTPSEGPARARFDDGLQVERTALSWQRTGLALMAGSLVGARIIAPEAGWWGIGLGVAGALLGLFVFVQSGIRHRHVHRVLTAPSPAQLPGAVLPAVVAGAALLAGIVALGYVIAAAG